MRYAWKQIGCYETVFLFNADPKSLLKHSKNYFSHLIQIMGSCRLTPIFAYADIVMVLIRCLKLAIESTTPATTVVLHSFVVLLQVLAWTFQLTDFMPSWLGGKMFVHTKLFQGCFTSDALWPVLSFINKANLCLLVADERDQTFRHHWWVHMACQ